MLKSHFLDYMKQVVICTKIQFHAWLATKLPCYIERMIVQKSRIIIMTDHLALPLASLLIQGSIFCCFGAEHS